MIPIIIVVCCMAILLFMSFAPGKKKISNGSGVAVSAQDFLNVRDIVDHILYTRDDYCISYVRIHPPMSSLWSKREKKSKTNTLVAEISKDREPWTLSAVSRPMDISQLINQYRQLRDSTDNPIRKNLLKLEMRELQNKVGAGEAVERQFYIKVWIQNREGAEGELYDRCRQIVSAYEAVGITSEILKKPDIIRYCNLVHNPAYINVEDTNTTPVFPMITEVDA